MKDKFDKFYKDNVGKFVEVNDPSNYAQCMDLAYAWCDVLGVTRDTIRAFYAYQVYTQPKDVTLQFFELVPNTPSGLPQVGDLVVFSNKVGIAGHISIATGKGDVNSFETFDQNYGTPKSSHLVNHNFDAVLGWLHLREKKELQITEQTVIPQIGMEVQAIKSRLKDNDAKIYDLEKKADDQQLLINNLEEDLKACQASPSTPGTPTIVFSDRLASFIFELAKSRQKHVDDSHA